jgi:threonylcarbamoyladenosine tRNA methylthiotransferase MtaB
VDAETKKDRSRELHALARRAKEATAARFLGRRFPVLIEGEARGAAGTDLWFGYTPNYLQVMVPAGPGAALGNRIVPVRLLELAPGGEHLLGRIEAGTGGLRAGAANPLPSNPAP